MDEQIKISLGEKQKLKIVVNDPAIKNSIKADAYAIYQSYTEMLQWFSDSTVPEEQKAQFAEEKINLMLAASLVVNLLKIMGYDHKEIDEIFVLPF